MNRPVLVTPTRVDADSHRIPSGMARAADTAIIDDVSKIDRCWRSDSDLSCVHRATTVSRDGRLSGCSARASSRTLVHSLRSPATSSGGALMVAARRDEVRSNPSRSPSTVVNSVSGSSSPCALSDSAISGISWRPMPQRSASAARTQTGDARNATTPRTSTTLPAVRLARKSSGSVPSDRYTPSTPPTCSMTKRSVVSTRF